MDDEQLNRLRQEGCKLYYHFEDFTEEEYHRLIKLAKATWEFIPFGEYRRSGRVCLWRHDIDLSVHRACRLAQIEAEEAVRTTYFIHLHSGFYHPFEKEVAQRILRIRDLGHHLGLHFDPDFYTPISTASGELIERVRVERQILEQVFETPILAFSFHNPDVGEWLSFDADEMVGMVNAYGRYIRENYSYVSDSNGYWRFRRLKSVLEEGRDDRLHILTHPGWWTPQAMSPRARVTRCIDGRAQCQHRQYDDQLAAAGRQNVR